MNLRQAIEQLEYLDIQKKGISADIADIKKELVNNGYTLKAINNLLNYNKDPAKYEQEITETELMINEVKNNG